MIRKVAELRDFKVLVNLVKAVSAKLLGRSINEEEELIPCVDVYESEAEFIEAEPPSQKFQQRDPIEFCSSLINEIYESFFRSKVPPFPQVVEPTADNVITSLVFAILYGKSNRYQDVLTRELASSVSGQEALRTFLANSPFCTYNKQLQKKALSNLQYHEQMSLSSDFHSPTKNSFLQHDTSLCQSQDSDSLFGSPQVMFKTLPTDFSGRNSFSPEDRPSFDMEQTKQLHQILN